MYQNQPGPYHYRQPSQYSGPPPAKKPRGNPIITRYPPPPGYKPPVQPQPPYGQQPGWQQQPPAFGHLPAYGGCQQPSFGQQAPGYPPQYHAPHPSSISSWSPPITTPQSAPPQTWQVQQNGFSAHPSNRRHNSLPYPPTGSLLDGNGDPMPPADLLMDNESLEQEFDAECYFSRHPEQIDPSLSLGVIEWKAPRPGRRALPATAKEAELEAIAPRPPQPSDEESISDYFINSKREEALLSVRQTETWKDIKNELIFLEFAAVCSRVISMAELLDNYRIRYDAAWAEGDHRTPTPELSRGPTPANDESNASRNGSAMEVDERRRSVTPGSEHGVLDDLERALRGDSRSETHSRTGSVSSQHTKFQRPKPLPPIHDSRQEELLAALGVTGSPKLVYQTPGPAFGPPPPAKQNHSRTNSVASAHSERQSLKPDNRADTTRSFDAEPDNDATPRPKWTRNDSSRKRSYADTAAGAANESASEDDQATPKQRRKQQRVGGD